MSTETLSLADREAELKTRAANIADELDSFNARIAAGETRSPKPKGSSSNGSAATNRER